MADESTDLIHSEKRPDLVMVKSRTSGTVKLIDQREAPDFLRRNAKLWSPATAGDVKAARDAREYGGAGGMVATAVQGAPTAFLDALTAIPRIPIAGAAALGVPGAQTALDQTTGRAVLSNLSGIYGELSGQGSAEAITRRKAEEQQAFAEQNPWTAGISTAVGQVAGTLGIGALAGGAAKVGAAGLETAATAAPKAGAFATAGRAGLRLAAEGAPLGGAVMADQAYIANRRLTGEEYLAGVGVAGLLSGGLGAVGSLAASGGRGLARVFGGKAATKAASGAEAAAARPTAEGLGLTGEATAESALGPTTATTEVKLTPERSLLAKAWGTDEKAREGVIRSTLGLKEGEVLPGAADHLGEIMHGRAPAELEQQVHERAAREISGDLGEAVNGTNELKGSVLGGEKMAKVARTLETDGVDQQAARSEAEQLATQIRTDVEDFAKGFGKKPPPRVAAVAKSIARLEGEMRATEGGAAAHNIIDRMRRDLLNARSAFGQSAERATTDTDRFVAQQANQVFGDAYQSTVDHLQNPEIWGTAQATAQTDVNNAWVRLISAEDAFPHSMTYKVGGTYHGAGDVRPVFAAESAPVYSMVQGFGTFAGKSTQTKFVELAQAQAQFARALGKYELSGAEAATAERVAARAEKLAGTYQKTLDEVGAVRQAVQVHRASTEQVSAFGQGLAGSISQTVLSPAHTLAAKMHVEATAAKVKNLVAVNLDHFFGGISGAAEGVGKAARSPMAAATASALRRTGPAEAIKLLQGHAATPEDGYRDLQNKLTVAMRNNGQAVRDGVIAHYGSAADSDPHAAGATAIAATNAIAFLQGKITTPAYNMHGLTPASSRPMPSKADVQRAADALHAVDKPVDALLGGLHTGMLSQSTVEAVRTVYPALYQDIQRQVVERLRDLDAQGHEVPVRDRAALDTLLSLNGAGEPAFAPEFGAKYGPQMGDAAAAERQQAQRPLRQIKGTANSSLTQTDRMQGATQL